MAADRVTTHVPQHTMLTSPLRHYTGLWCLVVSALPVLVTRFGLIPVYESQRSLLPAYASFFCLLALAYVFSQRHRLARAMFAARLLWDDPAAVQPRTSKRMSINAGLAVMILGSLGCAAVYLWAFEGGRASRDFPTLPPSSIDAVLLALSYITLFLLAAAAFAVMAVREHMQHVLGLSDEEVITGLPRSAELTTSTGPSAARPGGIAVLSERGERFRSDELFKSESDHPARTGATDSRF